MAVWCEAAAEDDHDWNGDGTCRECGMGSSSDSGRDELKRELIARGGQP